MFCPFDVLLHEQLSSLLPFISRKFTKVAKQRQQVSGVAEPQRRQAEGNLGRVECHGEVLDKLSRQTLLQQRHVGGHVVRQEDEHADVTVHLDLSDLDKSRASRLRTDWGLCACGSESCRGNTHCAAQIRVCAHLHRVVVLLHHGNGDSRPIVHLEALHCSALSESSHPLACCQK